MQNQAVAIGSYTHESERSPPKKMGTRVFGTSETNHQKVPICRLFKVSDGTRTRDHLDHNADVRGHVSEARLRMARPRSCEVI